jgi:hypothetical protein
MKRKRRSYGDLVGSQRTLLDSLDIVCKCIDEKMIVETHAHSTSAVIR